MHVISPLSSDRNWPSDSRHMVGSIVELKTYFKFENLHLEYITVSEDFSDHIVPVSLLVYS